MPTDFALPDVDLLKVGRFGVKLSFDARSTPVDKVMAPLSAHGQVVDITISDSPLEDVIAKICRNVRSESAGLQGEK